MENKPEVVVVQSKSNAAGGVLGLLLGLGIAGAGAYAAYNYFSNKDERDKNKNQNDASQNASDPDYVTAQALFNIFDLPVWKLQLEDDKKAEFKRIYSQIKNPVKVREYYNAISKGKSLDDAIGHWINTNISENANKIVAANKDAYSTWKVNNGKLIANVKQGDKIVIKPGNSYFKVFKYFSTNGQPNYAAISANINQKYGSNGDGVLKYEPNQRYAVYWHVFTQKVYSYDTDRKVNILIEKPFALVTKGGIIIGYVDLNEWQRATPLQGIEGLNGLSLMIS